MSEAKISPAMNPNFMGNDALDFNRCKFYSRVFRITQLESLDENASYIELMGTLFPYDPSSNFQLNPMGSAITKTWTKEGDLLIHVEYIEMIESDEPDKADSHEF